MADAFDAVIEPGELAEEFDHGPTKEARGKVLLVPPVLQLGPEERLGRAAARKFLDLPDGLTVVALQLGSGSNFDMRGVRNAILDGFAGTAGYAGARHPLADPRRFRTG